MVQHMTVALPTESKGAIVEKWLKDRFYAGLPARNGGLAHNVITRYQNGQRTLFDTKNRTACAVPLSNSDRFEQEPPKSIVEEQ
jgi:hypothetical protein